MNIEYTYIRLYLYANLYINGAKFDHVFWYYTYAMFRFFFNMQKRLVPGGLNQNRYLIGNACTYIFFKLLELLAIKDA